MKLALIPKRIVDVHIVWALLRYRKDNVAVGASDDRT